MIDLPTLLVLASLVFGLVAGNEALYGDTLRVQVSVPPSLSQVGFTDTSAQAVFLAEAARIVSGESIIPVPTARVNTGTTVLSAMAKPLNLDGVVTAMQSQFGIDHLMVYCSILIDMADNKPVTANNVQAPTIGKKLSMVVVVDQPGRLPTQVVLEQPDGDATRLIKRCAGWAMEQVSPYRVVLAHALAGIAGDKDGFELARNAAKRFLNKPWDPSRSSELALTHNVLALLDLLDGNIAGAESELTLAETIPGVLPQADAGIALNLSFIAIAQKRPQDAARWLKHSQTHAKRIDLPGFAAHIDIQEALIAWANGDPSAAEAKLRGIVSTLPESETAHHYLAMLLRAKGDDTGADAEEAAARIAHRFAHEPQGLAVVLFWTDPVKGGVVRRQ